MAINLRTGLLRLLGVGVLLAWCAAVLADGHVTVPYFLAASENEAQNGGRQGFLRLINHSDNGGKVTITAVDGAGNEMPAFTVELAARQTRHFNSDDLETNPRDLDGFENADGTAFMGVNAPMSGHWRLRIVADDKIGNDNIEALEYVRTGQGFLTTMHDSARERVVGGMRMYQVRTFNPGRNRTQRSSLYVINRTDGAASVTVTGVDDAGMRGDMDVTFTLGGGKAAEIPSQALENMDTATEDDLMGMMMPDGGLTGMLGTGAGKWQLFVASDQPLHVLSLMKLPGGYISNLSTTTSAMDFGPPAAPAPPEPPAPGGEDPYAMMCPGLEVELDSFSYGPFTITGCVATLAGPVNEARNPVTGESTTIHESKWQMRADANSAWMDIEDTAKEYDLCVYDPMGEAGQYRLVIDQTVAPAEGEPNRFKCSSNSFTVE